MTNLKRKIIAVVTTLTVAAWMIPGSAFALTAAELQTMINDLLAQITTLQSQLAVLEGTTTPTVSGCTITSFDRNLKVGMTGDDVKCLQIVLNSDSATQVAASGVGSSGNETTYFGPLTKAAVVKFQDKYASEVLTPLGLTAGTGFVGAKTVVKLNAILTAEVPAEEVPAEEAPVEEVPTVGVGAATIALAADTPEAAQTALNAQDAIFTKIKFYGGAAGVTITKIVVTRGGVSADADVSSIKLYDGTTQLGSTQALNTTTHKATFSSLSWNIPAGTTKYLTIKGSIAASGTATVGDSIKLNIALATDITADATLEGTFPINGYARTIAGISVGELFVQKQTAPATSTLLSGATEQEIASWTFQSSTTEGMSVHSIKVTHVGSATRDDVKNIKLKVDGVQIGTTIEKLDSYNAATFDLSASPLSIIAGATKRVYAYADIASGIWTSRTIIFEITQYTDIVAYGANSGGAVQASYSDTAIFVRQTANTMTVGQGDLTVAVDTSLNPAAQTYVKGTSNRLISAFKFSSGSREGVRITEFKLTFAGVVTNISNITLWDGTTQIGSAASAIGSYVTFGANTIGWDATGLFDVAKSSNKTISVKADIPTGAATSGTIELYVGAATDVKADGLDSKYDLSSTAVTVTSASSDNTNAHTIGATGSLTIAKSSLSPAAQTYVKGSTAKEFLKINLTAGSGEDISVTSITLNCYYPDGGTGACASGTTTNAKLLKADGTQFGSTVASPSATAAFSGSLTIPASETVTLTLVADIPSTAGSGAIYWKHDGSASQVSTGVYSSADLTESSTATGNTITISAGAVTVAAAATPGDQTLIKGAAEVPFTGLVLTAGTAEDVRMTYLKLTVSAGAALGQASSTDIGNIALYEGTTRLTSKKNMTDSTESGTQPLRTHHTVSWSASDFLNSTGVNITKGQQKTITVKADLLSTAAAANAIAFGVSTTDDISTVGLASNSDIVETLTRGTGLSGVNYDDGSGTLANVNLVTISAAGTLAMANNAGRPVSAVHAVGAEGVGATGVVFQKIDFAAALEDIYVKTITVERSGGSDSSFTSITLWDGTTQLGSAQTLVNASTTFSFSADSYWRLPKGVAKTLTIKADLNGIASSVGYGAATGDAPLLRVDNVTVQGVSSGDTSITTVADLGGNAQYLRQSKPTLATATLPSTTLTTGEKTLYRWTVTADSKGDIGWRRIAFNITGALNGKTIQASSTQPADPGATTDGIYVYAAAGTMTKMVNQFKVWDLTNNQQITATTTAYDGQSVSTTAGAIIRADADAGAGYYVIFVPGEEQIVAAGQTKTYELRGSILANLALTTGDAVVTRVQDLSTTATTSNYYTVSRNTTTFISEDKPWADNYATTSLSFIWADRSAASHTLYTADWSNDYKVDGLAAMSSLQLTK